MSLPELFVCRLQQILPPECFEDALRAFSEPTAVGARVNTLLAEREATLQELESAGFEVHRIAWCAEGLWVPHWQRTALLESPWVRSGAVYVQNPSSMLPPLVLAPKPGEAVLDMCAAPGGKTLHLAALMRGEGQLVAVEAVRARFFKLRENLQRCGAGWVQTVHAEGEWLWKRWEGQFDAVLLDAPCSSEGRFRTDDPQSYCFWSLKKIGDMVRKQKSLIYSALRCLKPGGRLLYCTCTFAPEENEGIITHALKKFAGKAEVLQIDQQIEGMVPALTAWEGQLFAESLRMARRILPSHVMEGFFICHMTKREETHDTA